MCYLTIATVQKQKCQIWIMTQNLTNCILSKLELFQRQWWLFNNEDNNLHDPVLLTCFILLLLRDKYTVHNLYNITN